MSDVGSVLRNVLLSLFLIALGVGMVLFVINRTKTSDSSEPNPRSSISRHGPNKYNKSESPKYVITTDYKYLIPDDWVEVDSSQLQSSGTNSAISTTSTPIIQFRVNIRSEEDAPKNLEDFKSSTLEMIEEYQNYQSLANGHQKVGGEEGYSYTYQLGADNMSEQKLVIFINNQRAFSLMFTGAKSNFETQDAAFNDIINSFQLL